MALLHSGLLGVVRTPEQDKSVPYLGVGAPAKKRVQGIGLVDYPIFTVEYEGCDIEVYRHPHFFIRQSVWDWYDRYCYYSKPNRMDMTQYEDCDPRYEDAVSIYESELARYKKRFKNA